MKVTSGVKFPRKYLAEFLSNIAKSVWTVSKSKPRSALNCTSSKGIAMLCLEKLKSKAPLFSFAPNLSVRNEDFSETLFKYSLEK